MTSAALKRAATLIVTATATAAATATATGIAQEVVGGKEPEPESGTTVADKLV